MSTTYPLTKELEVTERSSRFYFSVRMPLGEYDLDHDWKHTDDVDGETLLFIAAEIIKAAAYSMGKEGKDHGKDLIIEAVSYL